MNLLRALGRILGGGGATSRAGDVGLYYYVKCDRCGEIIRVRVNPMNEMSQSDDEQGFFVRKLITGNRCYTRIEAVFEYDRNRRLKDTTITGGTLSNEEAYQADQAAHPAHQ